MTKLCGKELCVEHLNRCKTSHPYCHSRGAQRHIELCPTKLSHYGVLGYPELITLDVPAIFEFLRYMATG